MKIKLIAVLMLLILIIACRKDEKIVQATGANNVLLLTVDYTTNVFKGGTELTFKKTSPTFTISYQYESPGDFGGIKLIYQEINETLFDGSIIWMGKGEMITPKSLTPSNQFTVVATKDIVYPGAGFLNVFNLSNHKFDYDPVWLAVQNLSKVRQYLNANPGATVKLFLYQPSVGIGNPADWYWVIFLK